MINFPFGTNGNSIILGVPILKHITVHVLRVCFSLPLSALQIMESIPNRTNIHLHTFAQLNVKHLHTLQCLSIGTPKTINFPFVSNEKLMVFRCPNIQAHYNEAVVYLNFGTPKNNEFSIWNK